MTGTVPRTGAIAPGASPGAPAVAGGRTWRGGVGAVNPSVGGWRGGWRGRHHRHFVRPFYPYGFYSPSYAYDNYYYDDDYNYGDYCHFERRRLIDRRGRVYFRRVQVCT
jgi:hypothetical protein